jgi:hypothetical protein
MLARSEGRLVSGRSRPGCQRSISKCVSPVWLIQNGKHAVSRHGGCTLIVRPSEASVTRLLDLDSRYQKVSPRFNPFVSSLIRRTRHRAACMR